MIIILILISFYDHKNNNSYGVQIPNIIDSGYIYKNYDYPESEEYIDLYFPKKSIDNFNFAAVGDISCNENAQNVMHSISKTNPEFIIGLGDYSYEKYGDCWFDLIENTVRAIPWAISIGNHEETPETGYYQYLNYFDIEDTFYSFDYENLHFIAMDTSAPMDLNSKQFEFVENDLEEVSSDSNIEWIVIFGHKHPYPSPCGGASCRGDNIFRDVYHPVFEYYEVDLVLLAHAHNYERFYPIDYNWDNPSEPIVTNTNQYDYFDPENSITIITGTGGESLRKFDRTKEYIAFQEDSFFGHLNIDVVNNGKTLIGTFIADDGRIIDEFYIRK